MSKAVAAIDQDSIAIPENLKASILSRRHHISVPMARVIVSLLNLEGAR